MVLLSTPFAVLLTLLSMTDAAAVPRPKAPATSLRKPSHQLPIVMPLPLAAGKKAPKASSQPLSSSSPKSSKQRSTKKKVMKRRITHWDTTNPVIEVGNGWGLGGVDLNLANAAQAHLGLRTTFQHGNTVIVKGSHEDVHLNRLKYHQKVVVEGSDDHVVAQARRHLFGSLLAQRRRTRPPVKGAHDHVNVHRRHHHNHPDKVVVKGSHDHVNVQTRHHRHHADKVVVKGSHDHVNVQTRHHHGRPEKVIVEGSHDHVNVQSRHHHNHGTKVIVKGSHDHVNVQHRSVVIPDTERKSSYLVASPLQQRTLYRDDGVPGTVDIMSNNNNSSMLEKIASLLLQHVNDTSEAPGNVSFVLNASETNSTLLNLVVEPSPPSTSEKMVTLQLLMFDNFQAAMVPYCATFDPSPPEPEPLTMIPCFENATTPSQHQSQMFSYNTSSKEVRPVWWNEMALNSTDGSTLDSRDSDQSPQSVTLVFSPAEPETAPQAADNSGMDPDMRTDSTTNTSTGIGSTTSTATGSSTSATSISSYSASTLSSTAVSSSASSPSSTLARSSSVFDVKIVSSKPPSPSPTMESFNAEAIGADIANE